MHLYYRGVPYKPSLDSVEEPGTEHIGRFLGHPFPIKAGILPPRRDGAIALRYRGVKYWR